MEHDELQGQNHQEFYLQNGHKTYLTYSIKIFLIDMASGQLIVWSLVLLSRTMEQQQPMDWMHNHAKSLKVSARSIIRLVKLGKSMIFKVFSIMLNQGEKGIGHIVGGGSGVLVLVDGDDVLFSVGADCFKMTDVSDESTNREFSNGYINDQIGLPSSYGMVVMGIVSRVMSKASPPPSRSSVDDVIFLSRAALVDTACPSTRKSESYFTPVGCAVLKVA